MAKALADMTWLHGRAQTTATAGVSAALTEVTGFRQNGILERAQPGDVIVKQGDLLYVVPKAVADVDYTA